MKVSLATSGLLDPKRLDRWLPSKRQAVRQAVEAGMRAVRGEMTEAARAKMQTAFKVRKAVFVKSMRAKVLAGSSTRLPALLVGSKIPWLGVHVRGGTIAGPLLIPLLPEGQRIGRKTFRRIVTNLMRAGNAFFVQKGGYAVLMAENIRDNDAELRRFKRAERLRTGAKTIRRGQDIPVAVLVPRVALRRRFDLEGAVRSRLPALASAIVKELKIRGL